VRASGIAAVPVAPPEPVRQIALVWRGRSARDEDFRLLASALKATMATSNDLPAVGDEQQG